jgi:hypothetical protein
MPKAKGPTGLINVKERACSKRLVAGTEVLEYSFLARSDICAWAG